MKQQVAANELIDLATNTMRGDGIKQDYINQLSYTWNALKEYLANKGIPFNKETGIRFLEERYDIESGNNFAKFRPAYKRRRRAIHILLHCLEDEKIYRQKTYLPCKFQGPFISAFDVFFKERIFNDLALSTVNRDI